MSFAFLMSTSGDNRVSTPKCEHTTRQRLQEPPDSLGRLRQMRWVGSANGYGERRALLRKDHRQQPRGLRLAGVVRDLVRRAGLLVKHLAGGVRFFLALSRNLGDDGTLEDIRQHETGVAVGRTDSSWLVVHDECNCWMVSSCAEMTQFLPHPGEAFEC